MPCDAINVSEQPLEKPLVRKIPILGSGWKSQIQPDSNMLLNGSKRSEVQHFGWVKWFIFHQDSVMLMQLQVIVFSPDEQSLRPAKNRQRQRLWTCHKPSATVPRCSTHFSHLFPCLRYSETVIDCLFPCRISCSGNQIRGANSWCCAQVCLLPTEVRALRLWADPVLPRTAAHIVLGVPLACQAPASRMSRVARGSDMFKFSRPISWYHWYIMMFVEIVEGRCTCDCESLVSTLAGSPRHPERSLLLWRWVSCSESGGKKQ